MNNKHTDSATKKNETKFKVGDEIFVCDGREHHGKIAIITKVDTSYSSPRYDGFFKGETTKFGFEKETDFCFIETGLCELCGSPKGIIKPPYPVPEYGNVHDIANAKFPYAVSCICTPCKNLLALREEKRKQMVEQRTNFRDTERKRREKNGLCEKCGGEITQSRPCPVYEGTYETTHRCKVCGFEESFT